MAVPLAYWLAMRVALTYSGRPEHASKILPYERALRRAGLDPERNPKSLDPLAGLVLSGGTDVDPALYGQTRVTVTDEPDRERDEFELKLLNRALEANLPVLAICRGMQVLNVALGGTLFQHLGATSKHRQPGVSDAHQVLFRDGWPDYGSPAMINSRHHQAVDRLGDGLKVTAVADDGVIEAVSYGTRVIGVQWHPEDTIDLHPWDIELFQRFAEVVSGTHAPRL